MTKFKVPVKKQVDAAALAAFTAGAEDHRVTGVSPLINESVATIAATERQTESLLFRLTKSELDMFNFVFDNTNIKSKQKLLEAIIIPELHRRASEIRGGR